MTSPCKKCAYLSDDGRACMLAVHMGTGGPAEFEDSFYLDDEEDGEIEYLDEVWRWIGIVKEELEGEEG